MGYGVLGVGMWDTGAGRCCARAGGAFCCCTAGRVGAGLGTETGGIAIKG